MNVLPVVGGLLFWLVSAPLWANDSIESSSILQVIKSAGVAQGEAGGPYRVPISIEVRNSGSGKLYDLQVIDPIAEQLVPAQVLRIEGLTLSGALNQVNSGFDGVADFRLLSGKERLNPGDGALIEFNLVFDPQGGPGPFRNLASGQALDGQGSVVVDECSKPTALDPACAPTTIELPPAPPRALIGTALAAGESMPLASAEFRTRLTYVMTNLGEVELTDLELRNDLTETFIGSAAFRVLPDSLVGTGVEVNAAYDGRQDTRLLAPGNRLPIGGSATLTVDVIFEPGVESSPFYTQARLQARDALEGVDVSDVSTVGVQPDPDGDGDPIEALPTPIPFDRAALGTAQLHVGKIVESVRAVEGGYEIDFLIRVTNVGTLAIGGVQVRDDLRRAFPEPVEIGVVAPPLVTGHLTQSNGGFSVADGALLSGTESLGPGEVADISFGVRVLLNGSTGPFVNQALGTGFDPTGDEVVDESDDELDPIPGDDTGGGDDGTPIELPGGFSGSVWLDEDHDRIRGTDDVPAAGWIVRVEDPETGTRVEITADAQGEFAVPDLPASIYQLTFINPINGVAWARHELTIGVGERPRVDQWLDAQGIVYESGRRIPLPGVVLSLSNGSGQRLPATCLLPGQQGQTVDSGGAYRFDVQFGADPACGSGVAEYRLVIVEVPAGFLAEPSTVLLPLTGPLVLAGCAPGPDLPCVIQPQNGAPTGAAVTHYYLNLAWGPGDAGPANNHLPIDRPVQPAPGGEIRVLHEVLRSHATIGDVVGYRVTVENLAVSPLGGVSVRIDPPAGLPVIEDSLLLVRAGADGEFDTPDDSIGTVPVTDPRGFDADVGLLAASEAVELRYAARVSPGVTYGIKVSTAEGRIVSGIGDTDTASLRIEADPLLQKTTIIGKVFHDRDGDGVQGPEEPGIPGVRLATLQGLLVETDSAGRYHIADVDTGRLDRGANFMIKLDTLSLPENRDAERSQTQVVRLTPGLMTRINFPVRTEQLDKEPAALLEARTDRLRGEPKLDVLALPRAVLRRAEGAQQIEFAVYSNYDLFISDYEISLYDVTDPRFARKLDLDENLKLQAVDQESDLFVGSIRVELDETVETLGYRLTAYGGCEPDAHQLFDTTALRLLEVRGPDAIDPGIRDAWEIFGRSNLERQNILVEGDRVIRLRDPDSRALWEDLQPIPIPDSDPAGRNLQATYGLAETDGRVSQVRPLPLGTETWAVFDHRGLPESDEGFVEFDPQRSVHSQKKALEHVDPELARGLHETVLNCGCTRMAALTIIDSKNDSLSLRLTNLGRWPASPELTFDRKSGTRRNLLRMEPGTSQEVFLGSFTASGYRSSGNWEHMKIEFNTLSKTPYLPGFELERFRDGPLEPRLWASCDDVRARPDTTKTDNLLAAMVVEAEPRPEPPPEPAPEALFAMGLISLTLGDNDLSGNVEALVDDDHYDETVFVDGRVAGYLRGKIRGRYLVTAQIDTTEDALKNLGDNLQREDPQRIFRQLDPDRYYPVYGDDSTTTSDVESQGAMYLRVDWDQSSAVWGNYNTEFTDTEFAQYNRSLYGAKLEYTSIATNIHGESTVALKAFGSEAQTQAAHASYRATGGSLYYLPHRDIVQGSEKLSVEVRARDSDRVLDTQILLPGRDYEIDDLQGRVLLSRPLSQVVRERGNSIVRSTPLDGDRVFLRADYEYVPQDFDADSVTAGIRGRWTSDRLAVGLSRIEDQRDGRDYGLTGTDARWRLGENSFLGGEFASSQARQIDVNTLSFDGGMTFSDERLPMGSDDIDGDAWGLDAQLDLQDFTAYRGITRLWHKQRDQGFSSGRLGESGEWKESGLNTDFRLNDQAVFSTSALQVEREFGVDETVLRAQTDLEVGCDTRIGCVELGVEGRYEDFEADDATTAIASETASGDALLLGTRIAKALDEDTTVYGSVQTAVQQSDDYSDNDLVTAGVNRTLSERVGISAEVSDGDRGSALVGGVEYARENGTAVNLSGGVGSGAMTQFGTRYALAEGNELYGTYTVNPDRTDGARNLTTLGQRSQLGESIEVFTETSFGRDDGYADSAHVFGLDYQADQDWLVSGRLQRSDLKNEGVDLERQVASVGTSYQKDGRRFASRVEARRDQAGDLDTWQYLTSTLFGLKDAGGVRNWIGKLNLAWTDNDASGRDAGRFAELDLGLAVRPTQHDRINVLAKYSFLYDLGSNAQLGPNGRAAEQIEERSHVLSAEALYDLGGRLLGSTKLDGIELGAKIAGKFGEQRVFEGSDWYDTRLAFASVRGRYRLVGANDDVSDSSWEALVEYRALKDLEDDSVRHGALLGLYYVMPTGQGKIKVGVGYNFTDFDSDLRHDDYRSGGWFLDLVAAY